MIKLKKNYKNENKIQQFGKMSTWIIFEITK